MQHAKDYDYRGATPGAPKWPDTENTIRHGLNKDPAALQVNEVAVSGASNETTYAVEINGTRVEFTTDADAKIDELITGLVEAINSKALVSGYVFAEADLAGDLFTVTERDGAGSFEIVEAEDAADHLTITETTAHAEADPVPFGRAVLRNGLEGDQDTRRVKLPDAADLTARDLQVTLDGATDGDYRLTIEYDDGQTFTAEYTAAADSADVILQGLRDDINNNGPGELTASVDTGPTPSELHIVAETAGFADFRILEANGPSQINATVATAGDDIRELLFGIAPRSDTMERSGEKDAEYPGGSVINVMSEGAIVVEVEDTPSEDDRLYVRLSDNGILDQAGIFRHTWNSGAVPLPRAVLESERVDGDSTVVAEIHQT